MPGQAIVEILQNLAGPLGLGGVIIYYLRDRRKQRLADDLAERTLGPSVAIKGAEGFQAQLLAIERGFAVERDLKDRAIAALEEEVRDVERRCEVKVNEKETEIQVLRDKVELLTRQVQILTARLEAATS